MSKRPYKICKKVAKRAIVLYGLIPEHKTVKRTLNTYLKEKDLHFTEDERESMELMIAELMDDATIKIQFNQGTYK